MSRTTQFNFRIGVASLKVIRKEAKQLGITSTEFVRLSVKEKLKRLERERFIEGLGQDK